MLVLELEYCPVKNKSVGFLEVIQTFTFVDAILAVAIEALAFVRALLVDTNRMSWT